MRGAREWDASGVHRGRRVARGCLGAGVLRRARHPETEQQPFALKGAALKSCVDFTAAWDGQSPDIALYGGWIDTLIQRLIEVLRSIPTIPLWMGLAAALPNTWSTTQVYLAITIIISLIGWTDLARVVRGRFLSLREEDFVVAAELAGASQGRIIFRHMLPSFASHIIAAVSLALPAMIVSETALSFLGLGLRPPAISWGILLQDAQNIQVLSGAPWLLSAAVPVILVILAFNFLGDGLRDAADPYG